MPDQSSRVATGLGGGSSARRHVRPAHSRRHRAHAGRYSDEEDEDNNNSASGSDSDRDGSRNGKAKPVTVIESISTYGDEPSTSNNRRRDRSRSRSPRREGRSDRDRNRDRDRRRDRSSRSRERQQQQQPQAAEPQDEQPQQPVKWGLTINMRKDTDNKDESKPNTPKDDGDRADSSSLQKPPPSTNQKRGGPVSLDHDQGSDDEALDALIGNKPKSNPALSKRRYSNGSGDGDPKADDYRAVPIDDFGATLLKSFGWDGKPRGKVKEVTKKHANLAGLGARDAKGAEELDAWNQKISGKGSSSSSRRDPRPPRLDDYRREESKKRQRLEDRYGDSSYKRERERERERERHGHDR